MWQLVTLSCIFITWWLVTNLPAKCWNPNYYSTLATSYRCQELCLTLVFVHQNIRNILIAILVLVFQILYYSSGATVDKLGTNILPLQTEWHTDAGPFKINQCKQISQLYGWILNFQTKCIQQKESPGWH